MKMQFAVIIRPLEENRGRMSRTTLVFPAVESEDRWHNKPLYYQDLAELFFVTFDHQPGLYSGYTFIISGSPKNPGAAIHPKVEHQISFHFLLTAAQLWRAGKNLFLFLFLFYGRMLRQVVNQRSFTSIRRIKNFLCQLRLTAA